MTYVTPDWVQELYGDPHNEERSHKTVAIIHHVYKLMRAHDFDTLDQIMAGLDMTQLTSVLMMGFVRTTVSIRTRLPYWYEVRTKVHEELVNRGKPADAIMVGLMNLQPPEEENRHDVEFLYGIIGAPPPL